MAGDRFLDNLPVFLFLFLFFDVVFQHLLVVLGVKAFVVLVQVGGGAVGSTQNCTAPGAPCLVVLELVEVAVPNDRASLDIS